ncbi:uncharacterized protein KNAG_0B03240 [Huiozyma naganishii CBS 8797]|uniref:UspA domain-containing protein n=1 Tax=Huiozyma naganishii (strain ATCC MYA-139 / BCRC 22969 / CBS 8797 / KCTC 17520 / NBRC 10181 / NCYC 3082 / Yp74L-3) TaxID=1071383 RepID=J7R1S2_HUIN7|nr:hypothetical protein KNAG_0B03240 [Kazachstania naganishii CBS 8797]CCK68765.1 hypothetical protein KNAG_0B03240 [Kazachstania naganishii CBS 8797]
MDCSEDDERLRTTYRRVRFDTVASTTGDLQGHSAKFGKSVSFDTVPSVLGSSNYEGSFQGVRLPSRFDAWEMDQISDNGIIFDDVVSKFHHLSNNMDKLFIVTPEGKVVRRDYPSTPMITNDSMILMQVHDQWRSDWETKREKLVTNWNRIQERQGISQYKTRGGIGTGLKARKLRLVNSQLENDYMPRTVVCNISGRRHTWVALDWTLDRLAKNGDHIIVVANLPKLTKTNTTQAYDLYPWGDTGYSAADVFPACLNILEYSKFLLSKSNKHVKITIEVSVGKTKKILLDAVNLYHPNALVVGTTKWERTDTLVEKKSNCLKDKLCLYCPIPVFIVPAKRMYVFEHELQIKYSTSKPLPRTTPLPNFTLNSSDSFSTGHSTKVNTSSKIVRAIDSKGNDDVDDAAVVDKLYSVARKYRRVMRQQISENKLDRSLTASKRHLLDLDIIIDTSTKCSIEIDTLPQTEHDAPYNQNDDLLKGFGKLKRVITGGTPVYRSNPRPMIDMVGTRGDAERRSKTRVSQIKFAPAAKQKDGLGGLGRKTKEVDTNSRKKKKKKRKDKISQKLGSTSSKMSAISGGLTSTTSHETTGSKRLSVFKSNKTFSSRRGSSSSDKSTASTESSTRKSLSKLFGFK